MVNKNILTSSIINGCTHISLLVMLAATCVSMAELAQRESERFAMVMQPAFAYAAQTASTSGHTDQMMRRDKEEIGHSSYSYVSNRRSHSVTGSL